jgi:RND family efflux transporter MFP subunit
MIATVSLPEKTRMRQKWPMFSWGRVLGFFPLVLLMMPGLLGCSNLTDKVEAQQGTRQGQEAPPPSVETAIAKIGQLEKALIYTGNTQPVREVSLSPQVEGRLLQLKADVGDRVRQGQVLAQIDDTLLQTALSEAEAELAARESEVTRAKSQVSNAQTRIRQAEVELNQAQADAKRMTSLVEEGAISIQQAELAQTKAAVAAQTVSAAKEQTRVEQDAVAIARKRVNAQQAVVAHLRERRSYAFLQSPLTGIVLEKVTEPGNLVQPGSEVLKIGDFSQVKVITPVSELFLSKITPGQSVKVTLDAFPGQTFSGRVNRISPTADPVSRQIPIEIVIPNPEGKIGSGLLARVEFSSQRVSRVIIPQMALQGDDQNTVFVLQGNQDQPTVAARRVTVGDRSHNQVEVLASLQAGESFVVRSSRPLKDGETVRLSIISE